MCSGCHLEAMPAVDVTATQEYTANNQYCCHASSSVSVTPASPSRVQYRRSPTRLPQATIDLILEAGPETETGQQKTRRREGHVAELPWIESTGVLRVYLVE
jgi:hypothetical protein